MHNYSHQNAPGDNLVDERWDGGGYLLEAKEPQQLDNLFKNLSITKEVSPPLSDSEKNDRLFTSCFREEIEEDAYFSEPESPLIVINTATPLTTPPVSVYEVVDQEQECDYLTSEAAIYDNNQHCTPPKSRYLSNLEEDLSIEVIADDYTPIESIDLLSDEKSNVSANKEAHTTGPVSFEYYHTSLVQHYQDLLLNIIVEDDDVMQVLENTLPALYKEYLADVQNAITSCTL